MATPRHNGPTCSDYRGEMLLLSLHRRLSDSSLSKEERQQIEHQIRRLEADMGMD